MKNDYSAAARAVSDASTILIFAHVNPDGDAIGSSCALGLSLKQLGKTVHYALFGGEERIHSLIPETANFCTGFFSSYDLGITVDCSTFEYVCNNELLKKCAKTLGIDHHLTNKGFCDINVIDQGAAAAAEVVFEFIEYMGVNLTQEITSAVFIGISEDTGNFAFSNTSARSHLITSRLYELNPTLNDILFNLSCYPKEKLILQKMALSGLEITEGGAIAMLLLTYENGYKAQKGADTTGLIDLVRYIQGCSLAVLVRQTSEKSFKVSLRSNAQGLDVASLAASRGGGGHERAAGYTYEGDIKGLICEIKEFFRENERNNSCK